MQKLFINGVETQLEAEDSIPLLWALRENAGLTGTKYGCLKGLCGACTIHVNGIPTRSCQITLKEAAGSKITTIEGVPADHKIIKSWIENDVPQCGFCQPGQIMCALPLLKKSLTEDEIDSSMSGNLCRCGTYPRIKKAIKQAATT